MSDQAGYSVRTITRLEDFKALEKEWNDLLQQTAADSIFLTWEWLYTWACHYLGAHRLRILLFSTPNGRLVGIAPFYVHRHKSLGVPSLRELRLLGSWGVGSCCLDVIVPERHKESVLGCLHRYLHEGARGVWDLLTLSDLSTESSTLDLWHGLSQEAGKVSEITAAGSCPVLTLAGGLDAFLRRIGRHERYNVQRKRRRLENAGPVAFERLTSVTDVASGMSAFMELHQMRWTRKGCEGVFGNQRATRFHQEISRLFSEKGWLHLDFLRLNGERIAGIYGMLYRNTYHFYLPGFDPRREPQASPGILLLYHRVERAFEDGCGEIDFLKGRAGYKIAWATAARQEVEVRSYNRTLRAATRKVIESGKSIVKVLVR